MKKLITIMAIFACLFTFGQDMDFSQFYHNKTLINPAYTGLQKSLNIAGVHRNQWLGVGEGNLFQSTAVVVDYGLSEKSSGKYGSGLGTGLIYKHSITGSSFYTTDKIRLNLSSDAPRIGKEKHGFMAQFPVGISLGYIRQKYDYHNLIFSDQLDPVLGVTGNGAGFPADIQDQASQQYLNVGFGGMFGVKLHKNNQQPVYFSLGFSYNRFFQISENIDEDYRLPNKWSIHTFYHQPINKTMLSSGIIYQKQGTLQQLIMGSEFMPGERLSIGFWLRNKDYSLNFRNYSDLIFSLSYHYNQFVFGYSYDMTVSRLSNSSSRGTHEISLKVHLYNDQQRRINKRRENTTCFFHSMH